LNDRVSPVAQSRYPKKAFKNSRIGDVLRLWRISIVKVMLMFDRGL
jgi:hypothetical protein